MSDPAPKEVVALAMAVFGSFDQKAWDATRRGPFASRASINALRARETYNPKPPMTEEEYIIARDRYYSLYPSARR